MKPINYYLILLSLVTLFTFNAQAQDWKTFVEKDTEVDSLLMKAIANEPGLQMLEEERKKSEHNVRMMKKSWLQGFNFGIQIYSRQTNFGSSESGFQPDYSPAVGVNVGVSPYTLITANNKTKMAEAEYVQVELQKEERIRQLRKEIEVLWVDYKSYVTVLRDKTASYESIKQNLYLTRERYKKGDASDIELGQAEELEEKARQELMQLQAIVLKYQAELNVLVGE
ncbi:TolC family protein [Algivirga pacifica]|uniref:Outer membrane efflux protein n=1 Tax=Algivirga pacifica TaxID=1162670 RepID=A0ABP9DHK3_9BACT